MGYFKKEVEPCRSKVWAFIAYQENQCSDELLKYIRDMHIQAMISPLHSPDGEHKKPHWHCMIWYDTPKSLDQIKRDLCGLNIPLPFLVKSVSGYARYLLHKDDPEKEQFDCKEPICIGGIDYEKICNLGRKTDKDDISLLRRTIFTTFKQFGIDDFSLAVEFVINATMSDDIDISDDYLKIFNDMSSHPYLYTSFLNALHRRKVLAEL